MKNIYYTILINLACLQENSCKQALSMSKCVTQNGTNSPDIS